MGLDEDVRCIFLSPEYTFAMPGTTKQKPAIQLNQTYVTHLKAQLFRLSAAYPTTLLVPGTIATTDLARRAQNRCFGFFGGEIVFDFCKRFGVGEVEANDGMNFVPGRGYDTATLGGEDYGAEIYRDATQNVMPSKVNYHLVVGQGVGNDWIINHATDYLIVADPFCSGVFKAKKKLLGTKGRCQEIFDRVTETVAGTEVYYYVID